MTLAICFRCDADNRLGYGHLARCLTLAQESTRRNLDAIFVLREQDERAHREVARQQFEIVTSRIDDTGTELLEAWPGRVPVVLDMAHRVAMARKGYLDDLIRDLRDSGRKTVLLDSMGEDAAAVRIAEHVDMVISPYLGAESGPPPRASRWLSGAQYVVLPPAFQSPITPRTRQVGKLMLVTMGGADPWHLTEMTLESLESLRNANWSIRVVAGLFFSRERVEALRKR